MHYEDTIVTITDNNKNPLKEYESEKITKGRKSKVFIPFGSEYQFFIKNNNDTRIKIDIEIDGSLVTNDGLVINPYQNCYLERFLNSKEKFKFVEANNEAVSDPTNIENGIIKVRVYKEIKPVYQPMHVVHHYPHNLWWGHNTMYDYNNPVYGSNITCRSADSKGFAEYSTAIPTKSLAPTVGEIGATVGGSISNQSFTNTTWNGDNGVETCFTFIVRGIGSSKENIEKFKKMEQFLKLKEELGL